jgi:hypothetical protein
MYTAIGNATSRSVLAASDPESGLRVGVPAARRESTLSLSGTSGPPASVTCASHGAVTVTLNVGGQVGSKVALPLAAAPAPCHWQWHARLGSC